MPLPARPPQPHLSIVVPAYNEAGSIRGTLQTIAQACEALGLPWDILVVDDGSADATAAEVAAVPPAWRVGLLRLSRNFGKEAALTAGLDHAQGEVVVCMDGDGQHPVSLLPALLAHWREGYDMVYAVREDRDRESAFKRLGSRIFYGLMSSTGQIDIPANAGDFRLMDRCVVEALRALPERQRFMKGIYAWVGFRSLGLPYTPLAREHGQSSFSRRKLARLAWTGITSFSVLPLRLASLLGVMLALPAFAYGLFELVQKALYGSDVPGWPTVVVSIMFFSGVQLLFIGVLGEYLARVYEEVKARPTYLIAERLRPALPPPPPPPPGDGGTP